MEKRSTLAVLAAGVILLAGAGCSRQGAVLANIGSKVITGTDFMDRLKQLPPQYQGMIKTDEDKKTMLDAIVKEQLIVQEARERNIDKDKVIQNKINTIVDQILLEEMIKKVRTTQLKPTEAETKAYYEQHKAEYSGLERVKVAHILVKDKSKAEELLAKLNKGADFGALAMENSIDPGSSRKGGELDYFSKGDMVPEFEKAAFALNTPGQLSGAVQSPFGYHIIKLIDKKQAGQKSFEEAKTEAERALEKDKFDKWMEGLKTKWHVKVDYDKLKTLNLSAAAPTNPEGEK
jgi:peptidyl-prolyl cis-trans isomerase C